MKTNSFNIIIRLQRWMDSVPGQTFLNYAYSWGASIVILGALFKLTHLFGADIMLFIGMGTEVIVFFLSAFDRPFDTEEETSELEESKESSEENEEADTAKGITGGTGATIILGGGTVGGAQASDGETPQTAAAATGNMPGTNAGGFVMSGTAAVITDAGNAANPELGDVTQNYVEKLKELTEVLTKVEEQCRKMTTDSEEMINLNRTLTGINTVYELQLKNISAQIGTIDQINEQTRKMAKQIEELNGVYSRMIKALTVNMKNAAAASSVGDDE